MDKDDVRVILEHFDDKVSLILENIETLVDKRTRPIAEKLETVDQKLTTVIEVVKDTSTQINNHEKRITRFEKVAL